jgi:hypothetical protein
VDAKCEAILNNLPSKQPRSRLEPYGELITEMRNRGRTYREIAQILKKTCGLKVGSSTVNDFVLARAKARTKAPIAVSKTIRSKKDAIGLISTYKEVEALQGTGGHQKVPEGILRTIKDLKDRPLKTPAKKLLFKYNPDEPLRLLRNQRRKE